jgi:2,3-bisphosphoglycerate-dependent phosphoglycerate mutase
MTSKLILIRHGETEWNATGRIQGHRPVSLNERGHKQAQAVALHLQHEPFDTLYSSDLERTVQTAEAIANLTQHTIHTDARLREWDLGILSGLKRTEAEAQHPDAYAIYNEGRIDEPIPNGESIHNRYTRVTTCLEEVAAKHPNQTLVIVTHGGPLGDCYRRATNLPFDKPLDVELYNGGLNIITIDNSNWTLDTWGDIDHLKDIGSMGDWEGRK